MPDSPRKKNIIGKPGGKRNNNQVWVFVSLIILVFAISFFTNQGSGKVITPKRFEDMILSNDVQRVVVIQDKKYVEVYLKPEARQNAKYKTEQSSAALELSLQQPARSPGPSVHDVQ